MALVVVNNAPGGGSSFVGDPGNEYVGSMPVFGVSAQAGEALVGAGADVRLVLAPPLEAD
jgi:hypothetical protein